MNNIELAQDAMCITKNCKYEKNGVTIPLPDLNYSAVEVYSSARSTALVSAFCPAEDAQQLCRITVTKEDSYAAAQTFAKPLVLNFANAFTAGGGFLRGAPAQEESLCRCSTLYASLTADAACEMYRINNGLRRIESDYMLFSPNVAVFRTKDGTLLDRPFTVSVITAPAPDRRRTKLLSNKATAEETFLRRIRMILCIAMEHGFRELVLGAWGCGAFANDPTLVAKCFRQVIVAERYGTAFDTIRFAVLDGKYEHNYPVFRETFAAEADA